MQKLAMAAFGGNALLRAGQKGTYQEQLRNVEEACAQLCPLVERGYGLVIGHGNGPQVGNALLRHEAGRAAGLEVMPMDFCGAETQGSIGYLLESGMERALRSRGIDRRVATLLTRVEVDPEDDRFRNPSKPVGPYYTREEAEKRSADGSVFREDPRGRGWRKVVASPAPLRINNIELIEQLAREGNIVIAVGGGGIPVVRDGDGFRGVEAVIDKDLACALAAVRMKADVFYILTDVPHVCLNFHTPEERALDTLTVADARRYLAEGMFAEGSMAPKIRAGIFFAENSGRSCVITEAGRLDDPACGTRLIP
jgi:carbamate kinase